MLKVFYLCWVFVRGGTNIAVFDCQQVGGLDDPIISSRVFEHQDAEFKLYELDFTLNGIEVTTHDVVVRAEPAPPPSTGKLLGTGPVTIVLPPPQPQK